MDKKPPKYSNPLGVSQGELMCEVALNRNEYIFTPQFTFDSLPERRYDYMFKLGRKKYILEYDGRQHFQFSEHFRDTNQTFKNRQKIDVIKMQHARFNNYFVIRIDHTCDNVDIIQQHIENAISSLTRKNPIYYSNSDMYKYISDKL